MAYYYKVTNSTSPVSGQGQSSSSSNWLIYVVVGLVVLVGVLYFTYNALKDKLADSSDNEDDESGSTGSTTTDTTTTSS